MKVNISEAFATGETNNAKFIDLPFMSTVQKELLFAFVRDVRADKPLMGKNKPSWLDDNLDEIPHTEHYQANRFWHYHCGEFDPHAKIRSLTYQLKLNLEGLTSAAIFHYRKVSSQEITLVGFPPFPSPTKTLPKIPSLNKKFPRSHPLPIQSKTRLMV